jgi:hypothetical protein
MGLYFWGRVGFSAGKTGVILRSNWRFNTLMAEETAEFWGVERLPFTVFGDKRNGGSLFSWPYCATPIKIGARICPPLVNLRKTQNASLFQQRARSIKPKMAASQTLMAF